jgi:hypothetical protein
MDDGEAARRPPSPSRVECTALFAKQPALSLWRYWYCRRVAFRILPLCPMLVFSWSSLTHKWNSWIWRRRWVLRWWLQELIFQWPDHRTTFCISSKKTIKNQRLNLPINISRKDVIRITAVDGCWSENWKMVSPRSCLEFSKLQRTLSNTLGNACMKCFF